MSSTWVSGYRAGAFQTSSGFAYVTFHETCESNVFPRTPRWGAHQIDTLDRLGGKLVEHAYCCDGGMVRGPHGRSIRAEHYIERTEDALRSATLLTGPLTLEFDTYLNCLPVDRLQTFDALAQRLGIAVEHESVDKPSSRGHIRKLDLDNPVHGDLLVQLAQSHSEVLAWRIFRYAPEQGQECCTKPWHAPRLAPKGAAVEASSAAEYLSQFRLVNLAGHYEGQGYTDHRTTVLADDGSIVSDDPLAWFCRNYMRQRNMAAFGASKPALATFRKWSKVVEMSYKIADLEIESVLTACKPDPYTLSRARDLASGGDPTSPFVIQDRNKAWSMMHLLHSGLTMKLPQLGVVRTATTSLF